MAKETLTAQKSEIAKFDAWFAAHKGAPSSLGAQLRYNVDSFNSVSKAAAAQLSPGRARCQRSKCLLYGPRPTPGGVDRRVRG